MGLSNYVPSSRVSQAGVCTSTTRPASPYEGQMIYETDTDKILVYTGAAWNPPWNTAWGVLGREILTSSFYTSSTHSTYQDNGADASVTYGANRIIRVTYKAMVIAITTANDFYWKCLRGSTSIGEWAGGHSIFPAGAGYGYLASFTFVSSSAATETFKMQVRGNNNTQISEYTSGPMTTREFIVEDIGPA